MMTLQQIEEQEFRDGPVLWDADPDVCCAAYQLGACPHTEDPDYNDYDDDDAEPDMRSIAEALARDEREAAERDAEEPF